jgi:hypothetical protein
MQGSKLNPDPDMFANITLLLHVVGLLNQDEPDYRSAFQATTNSVPDGNLEPLEAVAAILVMSNEAIATASISNTIAIVMAAISSNKPADGPHEEVNIAEPVPQLGHPLQVAVVPNPTSQAAASNNLNDHKLRLLDTKTATNLWPNVKKNEWYCMFRYVFCHQCIHSFEFDPLDI